MMYALKLAALAVIFVVWSMQFAAASDARRGTKTRPPTVSLGWLVHDRDNDDQDQKDGKDKTFTVSKGGTLNVSVNIGTIRVKTWDKNEVVVHVSSDEGDEDNDEYYGIRVRQRENTVRVSTSQHYEPWGEVDIDVSIPVQFNVQLETSAGDITVTGKVVGGVEVRTSGGNISTGSVDGKVELETSGGDISTGDVNGDLTLSTSGGNINVGAVTGIAEVATLGGDIIIDRVDKKLTAETSGGNVHVGNVGDNIIVSTSGGDIILSRIGGNASLNTAGGNIMLESAHGAVIANTAGGDIRADSVVGSITARTSSGNIDVVLFPSGTKKSKLSTSVGDLHLYIPENAKATITARNRMQYGGGWDNDEDVIFSDYKEDSFDRDGRGREVRATYTLNGGGQSISLDASMGKIEILKPDSRLHDSSHRWKKKNKSKR